MIGQLLDIWQKMCISIWRRTQRICSHQVYCMNIWSTSKRYTENFLIYSNLYKYWQFYTYLQKVSVRHHSKESCTPKKSHTHHKKKKKLKKEEISLWFWYKMKILQYLEKQIQTKANLSIIKGFLFNFDWYVFYSFRVDYIIKLPKPPRYCSTMENKRPKSLKISNGYDPFLYC